MQAAVTQTAPFLNIDPERLMIMYDVNVAGPLRVIQAFADMLMRTANDPTVAKGVTKATVLNIGSVAAWGPPWNGAYGSSKVSPYGTLQLPPPPPIECLALGSDVDIIGINET